MSNGAVSQGPGAAAGHPQGPLGPGAAAASKKKTELEACVYYLDLLITNWMTALVLCLLAGVEISASLTDFAGGEVGGCVYPVYVVWCLLSR
jgi:hypothetical protein